MARKKSNTNSKDLYQEKIKNELNILLRREISDPRLSLCSVTRVELNPDFSLANVYWDTFDASKRGDIKKAFEGISGRMRTLLAKHLDVRHTPILSFLYDSQFEDELKITELLSEPKSDD
jgi:ribosome-binding factor A